MMNLIKLSWQQQVALALTLVVGTVLAPIIHGDHRI